MSDAGPPKARIRFILASASPARLATLRAAGVEPEVMISGIDESQVGGATTAELTENIAAAKALAVRKRVRGEALILGCDSLFEFEGESMGKPASSAEAVARWRRMRGGSGVLWTAHCLVDNAAERVELVRVPTVVHFAEVTDEEIETYAASGEPSQVAGAFTIDGFGGWFVDRVEGDHHNVVGLSLPELRRMLRRLNFTLHDIGYPTP